MIRKLKPVARTWSYDNNDDNKTNRLFKIASNCTDLYQKKYPSCFVTWEYISGRQGNVQFWLYVR